MNTSATTALAPAAPEGLDETLAAWRTAALADGWTEVPGGPHGIQAQPARYDSTLGRYAQTGERNPGDRSILLVKDDMKVALTDRDETGIRMVCSIGWFAGGMQMWKTFPATYDSAVIDGLRG